MWSALSTQHSALSTQHSALSTQHSALSTHHSALITQHSTFGVWRLILVSLFLSFSTSLSLAATQIIQPITKWPVGVNGLLNSGQEVCNEYAKIWQTTHGTTAVYVNDDVIGTNYGRCLVSMVVYHPVVEQQFLQLRPAGGVYCPIGFRLKMFGKDATTSNTVPTIWSLGVYPLPDGRFMDIIKLVTQWGPTKFDDSHLYCEGEATSQRTLSLSTTPNQKDPRPAGTGGVSTYELIATVTENGNPLEGVAVTFGVDVMANTGGHDHHDASRPKGYVNGAVTANGVTDGLGEIKVTFAADQVAGTHVVAAFCNSCANTSVTANVNVKVPDLSPISPNTPRKADGTYLYSLTSVDHEHQGQSRYVGNQYYLTQEASNNLSNLIELLEIEGWGTVALNDASLFWGGLYDISYTDKYGVFHPSRWTTPHSEHRKGEEIDISFTRAGNPIRVAKQKQFYKKFCEDKKVKVPFSILHHYKSGPHFHIRLVDANRCGKTPN